MNETKKNDTKNKVIFLASIICGMISGCCTETSTSLKTDKLNAKITFVLDYPKTLVIKVPCIIGAKIVYNYSDYTGDIDAWNKYQILYNQKDTAIMKIITAVRSEENDSCTDDTTKIFATLKKMPVEYIPASQFKNEIINLSGTKLYAAFYKSGFIAYWCYGNSGYYSISLSDMKDTTLSHLIAKSISIDSNLRGRFW